MSVGHLGENAVGNGPAKRDSPKNGRLPAAISQDGDTERKNIGETIN